jgi:cyclin-dependent kinase regulatory subunit CKS1
MEYSQIYKDEQYEYRHVTVPVGKRILLSRGQLMSEKEWREFGVQMSRGWEHYSIFPKERYILLFRRPLGTDPLTGLPFVEEKK